MMKADRDRHPREQHILDAMRLLGDRSQECRDDVAYSLDWLSMEDANYRATHGGKTKKAKKAAKQLAYALRQLQTAADSKDLDTMVYLCLPRVFSPEPDLKKAWARMDEWIAEWVAECDKLANVQSGKPRRNSDDKLRAAKEALYLMRKYGAPVVTTRRSKFCRLAAILHGDKKADMHHWCRHAVAAQRESGPK